MTHQDLRIRSRRASVAFLGLGVMGYPDGRPPGARRPRRHRLQPHARPRRRPGPASHGGARAPTPREAAAGADIVFCLRRQRRRPALGRARRRRRLRRHEAGRGLRRPHHRFGRGRARADAAAAANAACTSSTRRSRAARPARSNGVLTVMCGGDAAAFDAIKPVAMAFARGRHAARRRAAPASSPRWSTRSRIAGLVQGLSEAIAFGQKAGPGHEAGARGHRQGRGAELADGQPRQDDDRRQVRLRLRRRLDAQGPRPGARRGASATARGCR